MTSPYGCRGFTRRDMLQFGGLGLSALSLSNVMRLEAMAAADQIAKQAKAKNVIFIWQQGGPPHQDTWDMKPDAPAEIRGEFKQIATDLPGYHVCELMPQLSKRIHKLTVLRGVNHHIPDHNPASMFMLGSGNAPSTAHKYPTWSAVVKREMPEIVGLPTSVAIPVEPSEGPGAGFLGSAWQSFAIQADPSDKEFKARSMSLPPGIDRERFEVRRKLLVDTEKSFAKMPERPDLLRGYDKFYDDAHQIILSPRTSAAFKMEEETEKRRDRFGRNKLGQRLLLARRLVQAGVRFVTINEPVGWDTHADNFKKLRTNLPVVDTAVSALLDDLSEHGMLDDTLVMMFGEFGRTPTINKQSGRDHWAKAMSIILAGGGVPGGLIYGKTDKEGAHVVEASHSPADFACTIYSLLGIDPHKRYVYSGQPVPLVNGGNPITAICGA
jgi:hypothetical protein